LLLLLLLRCARWPLRLLLRFLRLRLPFLLGTLSLRLLLLAAATPVALTLRRTIAAARPLLTRDSLLALRRFAGPLFELADLALHVPSRLLLLPIPSEVVATVRATLPPFGIRTFAGRAENGFRERHLRIGAHCTLRLWTTIDVRRCSR
jgi:hypothetical protein